MFYEKNNFKKKKNEKIKKKNIIGIIKKNFKGFGFLEDINTKKNYYISKKNMLRVFHGDQVLAEIIKKNKYNIAIPKKIIVTSLNKFIGFIKKINNKYYILPKSSFNCKYINIVQNDINKFSLQQGDWFFAKLLKHALHKEKIFEAKLIKKFKKKKNVFLPWLVILKKYNLDNEDPKFFEKNFFYKFKHPRKDLTKIPFITIDNFKTKDIDDAVFIKQTNSKNIILKVAISDPTEFVKENSVLDKIAKKRAFTHYLPGLNIPMLPRFLSENLCSLIPNKKRPALVCEMVISKNGKLKKKSRFYLSWIKSHAKLSYETVSNWLENKGTWNPKNKILEKQLILLKKFYYLRYSWRKNNSLVFPENVEYKFHISNFGKVIDIYTEKKKIAHKIIEESMIAANITAARKLSKYPNFGIYNIHEGFDKKNSIKVSNFLSKRNIYFSSKELSNLIGFQKLYNYLIFNKSKELLIKVQRFQSLGKLSNSPKPHFGLGLKLYATWTSPIRKYTDIINHRYLKNIVLHENNKKIKQKFLVKILERKRKQKFACKEIENWLYAIFLKDKKNFKKVFLSKIINIYQSGIKVKIIQNGATAFIPKSYLNFFFKNSKIFSNYIIDDKNEIIFEKNKIIYKIFDIIKISVVKVDLSTNRIIAKIVF